MIIDFHTHTFPDKIAEKTMRHLAGAAHAMPCTDGTTQGLIRSMTESGVDYSLNLPVATSPNQVEKVNRSLAAGLSAMKDLGILTLGCMHPDYSKCKEELHFLKDHGIPGIKLHPAYQKQDLDDIRMMRVIDAASELDMVVLVHAGIDIGIPDHDYSSVSHILKIINEIQPPRFVLAHMGGWGCWGDVERDLAGADVWFDTAFSIGPIERLPGDPLPPLLEYNLPDKDFVRLCRKHGCHRILFATDSPWADQKDYIRRIEELSFTENEKARIFGENAAGLLGL